MYVPEEYRANMDIWRVGIPVRVDGAELARLMEEQGLSGAELSRRSGVSASTINRLRRSGQEGYAERHNVEDIAAALSVPVEALLLPSLMRGPER